MKSSANGRKISFVDTPGHEAFTEMRARGATVTDIAVLVVAADDGVMPQTEEAISHGRAAEVPIVVALNKIDLHGVNIERIFQQLATAGLLPTEWGGDVEVVRTSATTGVGIDDLLETLFTIAELHDLKANPHRAAIGTCLEAEVHEGRGVVAKMIVQPKGTLRVGDAIICGDATGHVKAMYDTLNRTRRMAEAGPSTPINMTGLDVAPQAGQRFYVLPDIAAGRARKSPPSGTSLQPPDDVGHRSDTRHAGKPVRSTRRREGRHVEHHPPGRYPRLDRSDSKGAHKARTSRGEDQDVAGGGRRHFRGRRLSGGCVGRRDHRLQRRAGRTRPRALAGAIARACRSAATKSSTR